MARFRAEQTTYETLLELWPAWRDRSQLQNELDQISLPENFPEDAAEQFHRLRSAISDAQYRLNETLAQEAELGRQLDEMPAAQPLEVQGDVEALVREIPEQVGRLLHGHQIDAEIAETERVPARSAPRAADVLARSIESTDVDELARQIGALAVRARRRLRPPSRRVKTWLKVRRRRVAFDGPRGRVSALLDVKNRCRMPRFTKPSDFPQGSGWSYRPAPNSAARRSWSRRWRIRRRPWAAQGAGPCAPPGCRCWVGV